MSGGRSTILTSLLHFFTSATDIVDCCPVDIDIPLLSGNIPVRCAHSRGARSSAFGIVAFGRRYRTRRALLHRARQRHVSIVILTHELDSKQ